MRMPSIKFGTEGWRGIIADDFTLANVRFVAHAIAHYIKKADPPGSGMMIGYDCRAQSEEFAEAAAEVLRAHGFKTLRAPKPVSSPAAVHGMLTHQMQGAIMFTASHNPAAFHGIKFKPYYGGAALTEITAGIEQELERLAPEYETLIERPGNADAGQEHDPVPAYLNYLREFVDMGAIAKANLNVATDAMYGSGAGYLPTLLREAGAQVTALREERNPWFGGAGPEPTAKNLTPLSEAVRNAGAMAGVAVDGDADRIGAVDEHGNFVDSHRIFAVVLRHLVEVRGWRGGVVKTFSVSRLIDRLAEHYGLTLHETPIGFKFICELMLNEDILMGGEESGGIGIKRYMLERDGVLMAMLILEAMAISGKTLSQLVEDVYAITGRMAYRRIDAHFKRDQMPALRERLNGANPSTVGDWSVQSVSALDGRKFLMTDGSWLLMRASGTEPVVRVYAETERDADAEALAAAGERLLRELIGI